MIKQLFIKNYILIDELTIQFSDNLSIITGETGAGKSILLGALSLISGKRAETQTLYDKNQKCIVEATFDIASYKLQGFFEKNNLDFEPLTIIRREINPEGKSRAFVNDTPVSLDVLRELGVNLLDIHSQYKSLKINEKGFQLSVLDAIANHENLLKEYQQKYREFEILEHRLKDFIDKEAQGAADVDYYEFQVNELEEAGMNLQEQEILEQELETVTHAQEIKQTLSNACRWLESSDGEDVLGKLTAIRNGFHKLIDYHPGIKTLYERIDSTYIELKDITKELADVEQNIGENPSRKEEITDRLDIIYRLQQKHRVTTVAELLEIKEKLSVKLNGIGSLEEKVKEIREKLAKQKLLLTVLANKISENRRQVVPILDRDLNKLLPKLGMPDASLKTEMFMSDKFTSRGLDQITFLFLANKGGEYKEIGKTISGGELSRLMLSVKYLVSQHDKLPTIIFDEIDTGVSGKIANKVGDMLKEMSNSMQVICITHLPQIAGKGDRHYSVYKETDNNRTKTFIKKLDDEERIKEIAKMLSGKKLSEIAMENAKVLIDN